MTTPLRVTVTEDAAGKLVEVRCPCLRLTRRLTGWESPLEAITDLMDLHHRQAPACKHPAVHAIGGRS